MMHRKFLFILSIFIVSIIFALFVFIQKQLQTLQAQEYVKDARAIKEQLKYLIEDKQKSTMAISIALSEGNMVQNLFKNLPLEEKQRKLQDISKKLQENTAYKNVWIQVIDKNGTSVVRSWIKKSDDSLLQSRKDIKDLLKNPRPLSTISTGKFTISFKSIMPIYENNSTLLGFVETITHFNSITKSLEENGYDSILLVDKSYKNQLTRSLTKKFIDDYYIANFTTKNRDIQLIKHVGSQKAIQAKDYFISEKYFITNYTIYDIHHQPMAYYILLKNINLLKYEERDAFIDSIFHISFITFILVIVIALVLYKRHNDIRLQKEYFHNIVNTASEIIIIFDKTNAIDANKSFFDFFHEYKNLDEFHQYIYCICDLFVQEEGFISKKMGELSWLEYVIQNNKLDNKVKIAYNNKESIFRISVQELKNSESTAYTLALTDITTMEEYKTKLEHMSQTDILTNIGNRYFFNMQMEK